MRNLSKSITILRVVSCFSQIQRCILSSLKSHGSSVHFAAGAQYYTCSRLNSVTIQQQKVHVACNKARHEGHRCALL